MPRLSYAPLRRILSGMFSRSALDTQIWDSCRQGLRESCRDKCRKHPGPAVEKSVLPGESVLPSFQLYFGVPTELLVRDMQPEPAATPECTNQAELWVLPDLGPIACKGSETKDVIKRASPLMSTAISVPERLARTKMKGLTHAGQIPCFQFKTAP